MDLALLLFGLFLTWLGGGRDEQPRKVAPAPAGGPPPPWPQVTPEGLPPFPGSGWEYDEPPPSPVVARARQLLSTLWARGIGTSRIEQTAGRWIAYRAEITRGNKHGVVAYREKRRDVGPAPAATSAPAPAPASYPPIPQSSLPVMPGTPPDPFVRPETPGVMPPPRTVPAQPAAPGRTPTIVLPVLRLGMGGPPGPRNADVRVLQQRLYASKPQHQGGLPWPIADGWFGSATLKAVKDFQAAHGLDIDGVVGPATWSALFAVRT